MAHCFRCGLDYPDSCTHDCPSGGYFSPSPVPETAWDSMVIQAQGLTATRERIRVLEEDNRRLRREAAGFTRVYETQTVAIGKWEKENGRLREALEELALAVEEGDGLNRKTALEQARAALDALVEQITGIGPEERKALELGAQAVDCLGWDDEQGTKAATLRRLAERGK